MCIAVALMQWSEKLWAGLSARRCDMPGPDAASLVMLAINAPVNLPRALWDTWLHYPRSDAAWIFWVGLQWYWVACSIEAWRERREPALFSWRPARLFCAGLLAVVGLVCGLFGVGEINQNSYVWWNLLSPDCFGVPLVATILVPASLYVAWGIVLVLVFGPEFVRCLHRKEANTDKPALDSAAGV
jgi:hypothetical protein